MPNWTRSATLAVALTTLACSHTSPFVPSRPLVGDGRPVPIAADLRLVLIGDAGDPQPVEPVLDSLTRWSAHAPDDTLIVFLGDNAYPEGVTQARQADAELRLQRQLDAVGDANAWFVPGNHDWANGDEEGLEAIRRQEAFLEPRAMFVPDRGCPGPHTTDLPRNTDPVVRVVALDTQWWLHEHEKQTTDCAHVTPDAITAGLTDALDTPLPVVVVAHHPLATHGPHGGFFAWRDHLFPLTRLVDWLWVPLPGVGSLYPLLRWHVVRSDQDLIGSANRTMVTAFDHAFATSADRATPVIYAAGHEHGLQVLEGRTTDYVLVSGLGSSTNATPVGHGDDTVFAHEHPGFMVLDFADGGIQLSVVEPVANGEQVVAQMPITRRLGNRSESSRF